MHTRTKGNKGEDIACTFLRGKGFVVVERNYLKKWGEIDIIAVKDKETHFFEVKSVVILGADNSDIHRPEDNVHGLKLKRLGRVVEMYLEEKGGGLGTPFQFHVLCVYMDMSERRAKVKWLKNIIL